jgi:hypothetical protein
MASTVSDSIQSSPISFLDNAIIVVFGASGDLAKKKTVSRMKDNR